VDGLDLPSGDQAGPGGEGYRSGRGSTLQMGQTTLRPTARASSWDPLAFWFRSALRRCASIFCFPRVIPPPPLPSQSPVVSSSLSGDRIRIGARPGPSRESLDSSLLYLPEPSPAGIPGGRTGRLFVALCDFRSIASRKGLGGCARAQVKRTWKIGPGPLAGRTILGLRLVYFFFKY